MISVLCPTRLRPKGLAETIESLTGTSQGPRFEVLIAIDPDDGSYDPPPHIAINAKCSLKRFITTERYGYRQLHRYYNLLAEQARGDWLLLWNDDARMGTYGWDQIIEAQDPSVVLGLHNPHDPIPAFPAVPKRFVDALGHFSLGPHNDIWWQEIALRLDILQWVDVHVEHLRPDLTGAHPDSVHDERGFWLGEQYAELENELLADVETIRALIS